MRYFDYAIKCIIRNFIRFCFKPRNLIVILLCLIVFFIFGNSNVFAVGGLVSRQWNGLAFNGNTVIQYNGLHGRACFLPPNCKGIIDLCFSSSEFHCGFFKANQYGDNAVSPDVGDVAVQTYYFNTNGLVSFDTTVSPYNEYGAWFCFYSVDYTGNEDFPMYHTVQDYSNVGIVDSQQQTTNAINQQTNVIQQQTTAINQQTNAINNIDNTLTSTDYNENVVEIDSSAFDDISSSESDGLFTTIFTNFSNLITNSDWSTVDTITINLPFVPSGNGIVLRSDLISSVISNTALSTLVVVSWYSLFGLYCFKFVRKIIISVKSGDILGGLSLDDEVITSTML